MSNLRFRLVAIGVVTLLAVFALFPRNRTVQIRGADGVLRDTVQRHVPLRYGLDLQGGMHLALEVDDSKQVVADKGEAIDKALKTVRNRIEGFGVSEPVIQKSGTNRIIVELPGIAEQERALQVVKDQAFLEFKITDKTGAFERALPRLDAVIKERKLAPKTGVGAAPAAARGLEGLLKTADTGKKDTKTGAKKDTAQADTATTGGALSNLIQQGQMPGEYLIEDAAVDRVKAYLADSAVQAALPPAKELLWSSDSSLLGNRKYRVLYLVDARAIMTGEHLTDARPNTSPMEGTIVQFTMDNVGGRRFRSETGKHIGDYMAIVLDKRVMGRPPVIQGAISTNGQITMGGKDLAAAQDLALVLRAGALPVPLRVAEVRNIGPSLGQDSINRGILATGTAILLVVLIMIIYYRWSGVLAVSALVLYVLYTMAILAGFNAAVTLPGVAGLVLSIGIAVDANVLIFERIREELAHGKTVRTAIDEGFKHAMPAIVDSNVSTILTAAVLYQWGSGPVHGFAITLIAGVTASMVTAIYVVRTFYMVWLQRSRGAQTLSI